MSDSLLSLGPRRLPRREGGGLLPHNRVMGMCRWMESHFHDWVDYHGFTFSIELLECGRTFLDFWGEILLHIYR